MRLLRDLADLVQKDGPAVGQLENPRLSALCGPGEAPLLVAEQLAAEQVLGAVSYTHLPNLIYPGQVLEVPGNANMRPGTPDSLIYRVMPGDTLSALALRFDTTVSAIAAINHIANPNLIFVGQDLVIPQ